MRKFLTSSRQLFAQIASDYMLLMAFLVPLIVGCLVRFGVPALNSALSDHFQIPGLLTPYYPLFDLFLAMMTPIMLCFSFAMVMLEEVDDKVARYFMVTPLGKGGYLFSRIGIPAILSLLLTPIILLVFHISDMGAVLLAAVTVLCSAMGCIVGLMIVSLTNNKLEGMAMTKLAATLTLGILPPFFLKGGIVWLFSFLPSFWISKAAIEGSLLLALAGLGVSGIWIALLARKFNRKVYLSNASPAPSFAMCAFLQRPTMAFFCCKNAGSQQFWKIIPFDNLSLQKFCYF